MFVFGKAYMKEAKAVHIGIVYIPIVFKQIDIQRF